MKKYMLIVTLLVAILLSACTTIDKSNQTSGEALNSSQPLTISEQSSDIVNGETEKNGTVEAFELAVKGMSSKLQEGDNCFFADEAYYSYSDFDNDGNLELFWAIYDYRFSAVFIFEKRDNEVYQFDDTLRCSFFGYDLPIKIEIFRMANDYIIKNSYRDNSGTGEFSAQERFFEFWRLDQNKMEIYSTPLYQWRGDETPEVGEKFFKEENDVWDNDVTKEEFDKHITFLTQDFISKEIVTLDNHVIDYMQGNNLYNSLYKAYQEYQERTK